MNTDQLLDVASYAGKLLIESGAEIYRVEETMVRLCTSFSEVEDAQSFVTTTGIMFSITVVNIKRKMYALPGKYDGQLLHCSLYIDEHQQHPELPSPRSDPLHRQVLLL